MPETLEKFRKEKKETETLENETLEKFHKKQKNETLEKFRKEKKKKCFVCKKKITFTFIECKCGKILCIKHRYPDEHDCDFNYKKEWKEKLK